MIRPRFFVAAGLVSALAIAACKHEPDPTPVSYPTAGQPTYPPPGYPPPPAPVPSPAPTPAPTPAPPPTSAPTASGPPPAAGLPCTYDTDLVCPFGRCIQGRCGGCRSEADCKPGAGCLSTPVGQACMPGPGSMPTPPPPATAAPTPTPAPAPTPAATPAPAGPSWDAARARCVQKTNELRATKSLASVSRRTDREACIDGQAQGDAASATPHANFGKCHELAQNECPGWKGTPDSIVDSCLKAMFDEGPGQGTSHGHYNNIMEASYRSVACGFYVASDGTVWMTQDFYK